MKRAHATLDAVADARLARRLDVTISRVLRVGVILSLSLVLIGLFAMFLEEPTHLASHADLHRLTDPGAAFPRSFRAVGAGVASLQGQAIVALGLLLLIATPIVRVIVSVVTYATQRDRIYVIVTSAVLFVLLMSFVLGHLMAG
jgi:uncharacterized membrane protein